MVSAGRYNLREVKQRENSMDFKVGAVNCSITVGNSVKENNYPSNLEVGVGNSVSGSRAITLEIKRSKKGRISEKSYPLFEEYIEKIGDFSKEYSKNP
jgi:hypothetical protein